MAKIENLEEISFFNNSENIKFDTAQYVRAGNLKKLNQNEFELGE